ncbi:MAG: hypothetical protein ACK5RL_16470 [Acidimicrobiales bacterium]
MNLVELARGVFAWIDPVVGYGHSNVGLVIDHDGLTVIDTTATPAGGAAVRRAILELTGELELPIRRVTVSSSRVAFSGGTSSFWPAAYYGTEATSGELDLATDPEPFRLLLPDLADAYHDEFTTSEITHVVDEPAWLSAAAHATPLPGEAGGNLVVGAPDAGVVYAGALASVGVTPLCHAGDPRAWLGSIEALAALGSTVVPGHGPPGGHGDLAELAGYLAACCDAGGDPLAIPPGPWDTWTDRRFDLVNVERADRLARGDDRTPTAMFRLLGFEPPPEAG